ncbi:ABC transporter ATP-binding protein [Nitrosococcus oceani]|uniref:ABC transporter ATP-binding protein n=1 Tax=Nitrosococcus oceani TaxID=1229 RepID=UPI0004E934F7|nr:ABC transporter ATP-binding protein [Nitrosococcus oceani]KFI23321.1 sugar ABC transporter ATP-binding protein [Nitrosococcus oceani]
MAGDYLAMTEEAREKASAPSRPRPVSPPLIEVRNLKLWYQLQQHKRRSVKEVLLSPRKGSAQVHWALNGVSFQCHEGEVLGIVGHNGAGKSTLCLVLAGILTPDTGTVQVRGEVTPLLNFGAGFNRELTGRTNAYLYASFLGIPHRVVDRRLDDIIAFSELGNFIDQPMRSYSAGMKARLGFSVASILDPKIMILDESLAPGDLAFKAKSRTRMMEMIQHSQLLIVVSHSCALLRQICTHCLWLDHGQTRLFGEVHQVLDAYEEAMGGEEILDLDEP